MGCNRVLWAAGVVSAVLGLASSRPAAAQLTPDRTYYGIDREIPVMVEMPEGGQDGQGEPTIVLFNPAGDPVARASVLAGRVDLATFFPILWDQREPTLLYAQLYANGEASQDLQDHGEPIGAPLVLQPLLTPRQAFPGGDQEIRWSGGPTLFSGLRVYVDKLIKLETTEGPMVFRLRPDEAPNTAWHIRQLVEGGFYTDIPFHRVVPTHSSGKPFVIQAGDPTGTGGGGPGEFIDLEPSELIHDFGVLSMARGGNPDSNGSQFFIALSREATVHLNGTYTAFGEAVEGAEAILAIERTPLEDPSLPPGHPRAGRPADPPRIVTAQLVDASPFGTGPAPIRRPTDPGDR